MPIKRTFLFLFLIFFLPAFLFSQPADFSIRLAQDDEAYQLNEFETRLTLKKKGFKIQVLLSRMEGVYMYASFDDSVYKTGLHDPIAGFNSLPSNAMAEESFNKNKEILISKDGWSYWFYDPDLDWHRFNKKLVFLDSNKVVGVKSIKQLYMVASREEIKIKDIDNPLYLFFIAVSGKGNEMPAKEFLRRKVKIDWNNDDD